MTDLEQVRDFWQKSPLWSGESVHQDGTYEFFVEHRNVYLSDCFGGAFDLRFLPTARPNGQEMKVLDLGCGIGFWVNEFGMRGLKNLYAADLTQKALDITSQRLDCFSVNAELSQQNAEKLLYPDEFFDHVNCQGVIHHTPDTQSAISEISRVLKAGGTASISVYYRNPLLRLWPIIRWVGIPLSKFGGGLKGRGREKIFLNKDVDEIVRLYDGDANPIGKSYSRKKFIEMLEQHFTVTETYFHFFPARSLPFKIPKSLHKWLDKHLGFMIYASVKK